MITTEKYIQIILISQGVTKQAPKSNVQAMPYCPQHRPNWPNTVHTGPTPSTLAQHRPHGPNTVHTGPTPSTHGLFLGFDFVFELCLRCVCHTVYLICERHLKLDTHHTIHGFIVMIHYGYVCGYMGGAFTPGCRK